MLQFEEDDCEKENFCDNSNHFETYLQKIVKNNSVTSSQRKGREILDIQNPVHDSENPICNLIIDKIIKYFGLLLQYVFDSSIPCLLDSIVIDLYLSFHLRSQAEIRLYELNFSSKYLQNIMKESFLKLQRLLALMHQCDANKNNISDSINHLERLLNPPILNKYQIGLEHKIMKIELKYSLKTISGTLLPEKIVLKWRFPSTSFRLQMKNFINKFSWSTKY